MEDIEKMDTLITIPLKELTKYIRKVEKLKMKLADEKVSATNRYNFWQEEEAKRRKLEAENEELRKNLDDAKSQIRALLGVDEESTDADDGR